MASPRGRNSSVELLRIAAIVMVVLTHAVPEAFDCAGKAFDYLSPTSDPQFLVAGLLSGLGLVGDVLFLVISAWFLVDSKRVKVSKVASMIMTVFTVSVVWYLVFIALGYRPDAMTTVKQFFPTIFQNNWFISYYIVLYLIHPLLNAMIRCMGKKELGIAALLLGIMCFGVIWGAGVRLGVLRILVFVAIYFIVAWLKLYGAKFTSSVKANAVMLAVSAALYLALRIAMNYIGLEAGTLQGELHKWVHINNPVMLAFGISAFNLANRRNFVSKPINRLGALSMLIYIIHRNNLFVKYLQGEYFDYAIGKFGADALLPAILVLAAIFFAGSTLIALVYKATAEKYVIDPLANLVGNGLENLVMRAVTRIRAAAARGNTSSKDVETDIRETLCSEPAAFTGSDATEEGQTDSTPESKNAQKPVSPSDLHPADTDHD